MDCKHVVIELDAYSTGELSAETTAAIARHLERCSACRTELRDLHKETALYQAFRSQIETPADAWSHIQARLARIDKDGEAASENRLNRAQRLRWIKPVAWRVWAAAASVLLAVGLSLYVYRSYRAPEPADPGRGQIGLETRPQIERAVQHYQRAVVALQAAYNDKKQHLDPQLVSELDRNLMVIRTAIEECKRGLQNQPNNDEAAQFLLLNYEQEIETLRQITEAL